MRTVEGYSRIVLAVASLHYMPLHPRTCSLLYSISCLLDALDGLAARHFDQATRFGAVLDMVTDRCTTACLLVFLSSAWPRWSLLFQGLISLDLASHYIHMYATLTMGSAGQSHKKVDQSRSRILNLYYSNNVRPSTSFELRRLLILDRRMSSLSSACSTSCSSSRSISFHFLPRFSRRRSSSRDRTNRDLRRSPATPLICTRRRYSRVPTAPGHWSWPGRTS